MGNSTSIRSPRTSGVPATKDEKAKLQPKRTEIVKEIISTEESYVKSLATLNTDWERPLRKHCKSPKYILSEDEINQIFTISDGILCLHQNMLNMLEERLNAWDESQLIGDIFIRNANALKLYTDYINRYNNSMIVLNQIQKRPAFVEFARDRCRGSPSMALSSLLIQPIQRIPRYEMLLRQLVKNTWLFHPDLPNLENALDKIVEAATFINEQKRKVESLSRLREIQAELGDTLVLFDAGRDILDEGVVKLPKKHERKGKRSVKVKYCLMNDKLLIWNDDKCLLIGDLNNVIITYDEVTQLTLRCETTNETISIIFKDKTKKEKWSEQFNTAKKDKIERENQITRAVFIMPRDPVNEKMPLVGAENDNNNNSKSCCCVLI